jgi:hypothetical protein
VASLLINIYIYLNREIFSIKKISIVIYIRMKITINNIIDFMKNKQNIIITDKQVKEIKNIFIKMLKN